MRLFFGRSTPAILATSQASSNGLWLSLALFMLRVFADHPDNAVALDDLALVAHLLYRWSYFHDEYPFGQSARGRFAPYFDR
jgi:hypothetical protein